MKKMLCVLLVALMLWGTALAEGGFTLHNGTEFGMTSDEVIRIESQNGIILELNPNNDYEGYTVFNKRSISIANIKESGLYYHFANDVLFAMEYSFGKERSLQEFSFDEYTSIENTLEEKYGKTDYNWMTRSALPSIRVYTDTVRFRHIGYDGYLPTPNKYGVWETDRYSHRLIPQANGAYILIDHNVCHYYYKKKSENHYFHSLGYYYLTKEEAQEYFDSINQTINDL